MTQVVGVVRVDGVAPTIAWQSGPADPTPDLPGNVLRFNVGAQPDRPSREDLPTVVQPPVASEHTAEPVGRQKRKYTRRAAR